MMMWKVNGSEDTTALWVEDEDGKRVATIRNCENDLDRARLIAAAPELLAALVAIVTTWEEGREFSDKANEIGNARAAIAKAKGA